VSQPSLRITHFEAKLPPDDYVFEVWNPMESRYEKSPTFEQGMDRVQRLAGAVREMWVSKDPGLDTLPSPPPPVEGAEFAEFRVTAQAQRSYDIRSFDSPEWSHFRGYISQAAERISGEVGFVLAPSLIPAPPAARTQAKSA
jgi:hypothetical protein